MTVQISELEYSKVLGKYYTIYELCKLTVPTMGFLIPSNNNEKMIMNANRPTQDVLNKLQELVNNILDPYIDKFSYKPIITRGYVNPMLNLTMYGMSFNSPSTVGYGVNLSFGDEVDLTTKKDELVNFLTESNIKWDLIKIEDNSIYVSVRSIGGMQLCNVE